VYGECPDGGTNVVGEDVDNCAVVVVVVVVVGRIMTEG